MFPKVLLLQQITQIHNKMSDAALKIENAVMRILIYVLLNCPVSMCSDIFELHKELFETRNYSRWTAPIKSNSDPLTVSMTYDLVAISKFDAMTGEFVPRALLSFTWLDSSLSWNPAEYGDITSFLYPVEKLWFPPVVLTSSYVSSDTACATETDVRITYTGSLLWLCGNQFKEMCTPEVEHFPFDVQNCNSVFSVWGYTDSKVKLVNNPTPLYTDKHDNGQWERREIMNKNGVTYGYSSLTYTITFERKSLFIVLFVITPIFVLGFLNTLVFLVKPDTGEKLSYTMTVLLANALFLVIIAESMPKVSKPLPNICIMVVANFATSVVISALSVLSVHLYFLEPKKGSSLARRLSMYMLRKVSDQISGMKTSLWKEASAKIDTMCFVLCTIWISLADLVFLLSITVENVNL